MSMYCVTHFVSPLYSTPYRFCLEHRGRDSCCLSLFFVACRLHAKSHVRRRLGDSLFANGSLPREDNSRDQYVFVSWDYSAVLSFQSSDKLVFLFDALACCVVLAVFLPENLLKVLGEIDNVIFGRTMCFHPVFHCFFYCWKYLMSLNVRAAKFKKADFIGSTCRQQRDCLVGLFCKTLLLLLCEYGP